MQVASWYRLFLFFNVTCMCAYVLAFRPRVQFRLEGRKVSLLKVTHV